VVARGWADVQNHKSLTKGGNYDSKRSGEQLVPGKFYNLTFDLEPTDEFIPAEKRLGVMIMSSDREFTLWPQPGTELTVDLARSSFAIPIVGGAAALVKAGGITTSKTQIKGAKHEVHALDLQRQRSARRPSRARV
jgi:X-Pro dipeptidyl-peptidase